MSNNTVGEEKFAATECSVGPTLVSTQLIPDPKKLRIRGIHNGKVMQDESIRYVLDDCEKYSAG